MIFICVQTNDKWTSVIDGHPKSSGFIHKQTPTILYCQRSKLPFTLDRRTKLNNFKGTDTHSTKH